MNISSFGSKTLSVLFVTLAVFVGACGKPQPAPRVVYTPAEAGRVLGAYEFWSPSAAEVGEALAAVDQAIASNDRLKSVRAEQFGLAIVGRVEGGVRFVDIYGEQNWAKAGVPSPATMVVGYSPTYLRAVYDTQKKAVTQLTAPQRKD